MNTYKIIKSWHGTGRCKKVRLSVPLKGHAVVTELKWMGGGYLNTAIFDNTRGVGSAIFDGSLETAGYVKQ